MPAERWREKRRGARAAASARLVAATGAQRRPRVVRHLAGPDEIPERGQRDLGARARSRRRRSCQNSALRPSASRIVSCASPSGRGAAAGRPSAARPRGRRRRRGRGRRRPRRLRPTRRAGRAGPGLKPGTRRGSTSDSHSETGNESPCSGTSASRSVARRSMPCQSAGSGRARPARRARPPCAAPRATRGAGDAARPDRTTPARFRRDGARRARAAPRRSSCCSNGSTSRPKRSFACAVVNGPRPRA